VDASSDQLGILVDALFSGVGAFVWHVLPAVTGVLVGGLLINRFFVRKANVAGVVDRACDRLDELKDLCADYWTSESIPGNSKTNDILETKIKASVLQINALVGILAEKYGPVPGRVKELILHLQDQCTGGNFESLQRKSDKQQFMRIARAIDQLATALLKLKL